MLQSLTIPFIYSLDFNSSNVSSPTSTGPYIKMCYRSRPQLGCDPAKHSTISVLRFIESVFSHIDLGRDQHCPTPLTFSALFPQSLSPPLLVLRSFYCTAVRKHPSATSVMWVRIGVTCRSRTILVIAYLWRGCVLKFAPGAM